MAATVELPRRLASAEGALAGLYPFKVLDLARALAEPVLLGRGLRAWDNGHDALVAARLLAEEGEGLGLPAELPRRPVATTLARTLRALRQGRLSPDRVLEFADRPGHSGGDAERLRRIPGIGQKTASRLVLELKNRLEAPAEAPVSVSGGDEEVVSALVSLGYSQAEAAAAAASVPNDASLTVEDKIRRALQFFASQ